MITRNLFDGANLDNDLVHLLFSTQLALEAEPSDLSDDGLAHYVELLEDILSNFNTEIFDLLYAPLFFHEEGAAWTRPGVEAMFCAIYHTLNTHKRVYMEPNRPRPYYCFVCSSIVGANETRQVEDFLANAIGIPPDDEKCVCKYCLSKLVKCRKCTKYTCVDTLIRIQGVNHCHECAKKAMDRGEFIQCASCNSFIHFDDAFTHDSIAHGSVSVCSNCIQTRLTRCNRCLIPIMIGIDEAVRVPGASFLCPNCARRVNPVRGYNYYDNNPKILKLDKENIRHDTLLVGFEIEMEQDFEGEILPEQALGEKLSKFLPEEFSLGYFKHDGSLTSGIELASNPMTVSWYLDHRKDLNTFLDSMVNEGMRCDQIDDTGEKNCGLHIHLSKAAFTSVHLYKFVRFFYKMHMRRFVQDVAERNANHFAKFLNTDFANGVHMAKYKQNLSRDRYSVINMVGGHWHEERGEPSKTVEFRLFQGTLDKQKFHKNIQFLLSVYDFTLHNSLTHISMKNYFKFLRENENKFRNLINFIVNDLGWRTV